MTIQHLNVHKGHIVCRQCYREKTFSQSVRLTSPLTPIIFFCSVKCLFEYINENIEKTYGDNMRLRL